MTPTPITLTAAPLDGPADAPVLVLANSLGTTARVWAAEAIALREHYRLLRFELPGHGGAPAPAGPYTIGQLGAGLLALLDALEIERAAYCGISLGAMIGMWAAAQAPDRFAALGLVCTSAYLPPANGWQARADQVRTAGMMSISDQVLSRWFTPDYLRQAGEVIGAVRADLERTSPEGYAGCCEAISAMDLRDRLAAITAPTLVLAGADDPATPPDHGARIADGIQRARLEVISGAAHLATVSAPEHVTRSLADHLGAYRS